MLSVPGVQIFDMINALLFPLHGANLGLEDDGSSAASLCCQAITLTGHCCYCCWCCWLPSDCIHGTGSHRHGDGPREEDPERGGSSELTSTSAARTVMMGINLDFILWKKVMLIGAKSVSNWILIFFPIAVWSFTVGFILSWKRNFDLVDRVLLWTVGMCRRESAS